MENSEYQILHITTTFETKDSTPSIRSPAYGPEEVRSSGSEVKDPDFSCISVRYYDYYGIDEPDILMAQY